MSSDGGPEPSVENLRQIARRPRIRRTSISPPRAVSACPALVLVIDDEDTGPILRSPRLGEHHAIHVAGGLVAERRGAVTVAAVAVVALVVLAIAFSAPRLAPRSDRAAAREPAPVSTTTLNAAALATAPQVARAVAAVDVNDLPAAPQRPHAALVPAASGRRAH